MSRRPRIALTVGLATLCAAAATTAATARAGARPRSTATRGAVEALAADGPLLAYDVGAPAGCNTVHVWDTRTGRDVVVSGRATCAADSTSTGAGVRELALAGRRAAWIVNLGGNTESTDTLYTAVLGRVREHRVASATRRGDVDGELDGGWLGNLAGDRDLLALNRWSTASGAVVAASLRRLQAGLTPVGNGIDTLNVRAVDSGRIAVLRGDGTVAVYDASGAVVSSFTPTAPARELALRKDYVVALEPGRLDVRLAATGTPVKTLPVPSGARHLDVHANVATFSVGRAVYALRLATGRQATLATAPKAVVDVRIDDAGVVYAYNRVTGVNGRGTVVFLPLSLVQRAVR